VPGTFSGVSLPEHAPGTCGREVDADFLALPLRALADAALATARAGGAEHADLRVHRMRTQRLELRDGQVVSASDGDRVGLAVRVLVGGVWGFASHVDLTADTAVATARQALEVALEVLPHPDGGGARLFPAPGHLEQVTDEDVIRLFEQLRRPRRAGAAAGRRLRRHDGRPPDHGQRQRAGRGVPEVGHSRIIGPRGAVLSVVGVFANAS